VLDAVAFQMTDLLGQGDYGGAFMKLQQLFKMQQDPIAILGAVSMHFRRLSMAKRLLENGKTAPDLMKLAGMGDYPARKTMSAAGKFSARFFARTAELILESDQKMKTSFDDPERILEVLILQIAQEAKND
jgi:DNA polymerase-3 subunit delta